MKRIKIISYMGFFLLCVSSFYCTAQAGYKNSTVTSKIYGIIIKGGIVIDPKNNRNELMDVAINDGKIALVAKNINSDEATQVVEAKGMYVMPGLIDINTKLGHTLPDGFTLRVGVTTIVNAGDADFNSFQEFKESIIDKSITRVLSLLMINGGNFKGGPHQEKAEDSIASKSARLALLNKGEIVGFKVNFVGPDWSAVDRGIEAGNLANMPIMLDGGRNHPHPSLEDLFNKHLRVGDIYTHTYTIIEDINARQPIVDQQTKKIHPFFLEAQKKGIIFDVGHGSAFRYSNAIPAMKSGFFPNTISTELYIASTNAFMKDILNVMSKFLLMGMNIEKVVNATTWSPAKAIKREDLGNLSPGAIADVAILSIRKGKFGYYETSGYKMEGDQKLECEMTIKGGRIVYDLNGIATPINNFFRSGNEYRFRQ